MDYKYLVETKTEFNKYLNEILNKHIYHALKGMAVHAKECEAQFKSKKMNIDLIFIFRKTLKGMANLNNNNIEKEYLRVKQLSNCSEWFDNLVRAAIKSYILMLNWDPINNKSLNDKYIDNEFYNTISIKDFIHKCYVSSCDYFIEQPEIFLNRTNRSDIYKIINECIELTIKKTVPFNDILNDYLNIDYDISKQNKHNDEKLQLMVQNIMNKHKFRGKILESDNSDYNDVNNFIDRENILQTEDIVKPTNNLYENKYIENLLESSNKEFNSNTGVINSKGGSNAGAGASLLASSKSNLPSIDEEHSNVDNSSKHTNNDNKDKLEEEEKEKEKQVEEKVEENKVEEKQEQTGKTGSGNLTVLKDGNEINNVLKKIKVKPGNRIVGAVNINRNIQVSDKVSELEDKYNKLINTN